MIIEVEMIKRRVMKEMERMVIEVERTETDISISIVYFHFHYPLLSISKYLHAAYAAKSVTVGTKPLI